ncbi:hypothetical protein CB1_000746007 [Camelus ferus]|nr:hypothetical protein CB1_000746007 [Camelus ferus]
MPAPHHCLHNPSRWILLSWQRESSKVGALPLVICCRKRQPRIFTRTEESAQEYQGLETQTHAFVSELQARARPVDETPFLVCPSRLSVKSAFACCSRFSSRNKESGKDGCWCPVLRSAGPWLSPSQHRHRCGEACSGFADTGYTAGEAGAVLTRHGAVEVECQV